MAKQSAIEQDGVIVEALSNAMFRVMAVCMLLTRKILSINNVKDNLLFLQKK